MGVLKAAARQNAGKGFERKMLRSSLLRPLLVYLSECCRASFRVYVGHWYSFFQGCLVRPSKDLKSNSLYVAR